MSRIIRVGLYLVAIVGVLCKLEAQEASRGTVIIDKEILSEKSILLKSIANRSSEVIEIKVDGKRTAIVLLPDETESPNITCSTISVSVSDGLSGFSLWTRADTKAAWEKLHPSQEKIEEDIVDVKSDSKPKDTVKSKDIPVNTADLQSRKPSISYGEIVLAFKEYLETDDCLSESAISRLKSTVDWHRKELASNPDNKVAYVQQHRLYDFLQEEQAGIDAYYESMPDVIDRFVSRYDEYEIKNLSLCETEIRSLLNKKLGIRQKYIQGLKNAMEDASPVLFDFSRMDDKVLINIGAIGLILVLLLVWFIHVKKRRRSHKRQAETKKSQDNSAPAIVVRRKTTSILKKQSLDDVVDNDEYKRIDCSDFCNDSAVRIIYMKNTCIKDIYNMYAEDLRNPDNPKEDGCMVLGRWVFDAEADEYYVSLEQIVRPGDDAVFQEYELNFGGKIKLKVAENLRKLRRDTDLQYDLTCWVHSHPGLGVFFSNFDNNVHMQLKHPSHPKFLTAMVIDILTPRQEFGIFTFRHDSTINSKNDLKKMYSLEELHKWAVESSRRSFRPEDYYDILANAELRSAGCHGIELNNGAIIDMCTMVNELSSGLAGWVYGYPHQQKERTEYVVKAILKTDVSADNDLLGCFVIGTHCSIPSIRKVISAYSTRIKFILFYSTVEETLTAIPMVDGLPGMDDKYYSEDKLDNLKVWTRRKR